MRFGVFGINVGACADPDVQRRVVLAAEETGFESVWTSESAFMEERDGKRRRGERSVRAVREGRTRRRPHAIGSTSNVSAVTWRSFDRSFRMSGCCWPGASSMLREPLCSQLSARVITG